MVGSQQGVHVYITAILLPYKMAVCGKLYTLKYNIRTMSMQAHSLYKLCPATLYGVVQSRYCILCHMTCISNTGLENGEKKTRISFLLLQEP